MTIGMEKKPVILQCTQCSSNEVVPIVYGLPTFDTYKESKGKVVFGGCVIDGSPPKYQCLECEKEYHSRPAKT